MMLAIALATRNCNTNNIVREMKEHNSNKIYIKNTLIKNKYFSFIIKRSLYHKSQKQNIS